MDSIDRSDSNVPARFPMDSPRPPAPMAAIGRELALTPTAAPLQVNPRVLLRGLGRHWGRILLLWLILSAPLAYLIYMLVEPTYQAFSLLRVEPAGEPVYGSGRVHITDDLQTAKPYLQTQANIISSDRVLDPALASRTIANLPMIKKSLDPKADVREKMTVEIVDKGTYLIRIALESPNPVEAAAVVNAVVESYLEQNTEYHRTSNKNLRTSLESELKKVESAIQEKRGELKILIKDGEPETGLTGLKPRKGEPDDEDSALQSSFSAVTAEELGRARHSLLQTDLDLLAAQADLEAAQQVKKRAEETAARPAAQPSDERLQQQIEAEFRKDPEVVALVDEIQQTEEHLDSVKKLARQPSDPARRAARERQKQLMTKYEQIWKDKHPEILRRLTTAEALELGPDQWASKIEEHEARVAKLRKQKESLHTYIEKLKGENKAKNKDTLDYTLATQDLAFLKSTQTNLSQRLKQLEFEKDQDQQRYRITPVDKASVPKSPSNNKRLKYMAAAPVGILLLMLGLFLMLEIKSQRIADPDTLSNRVHSEVYALPPLPTARSIGKKSLPDADDQIEQFIQRLDHLRFAVCGSAAELEKGRCVLITSSIGGEGKTTLAAQLAARCGNAGMNTLLIDADLRRTGLCSLLDVAEGPGLSDALLHDEPLPTELVIPVQGGTFHLLPAGTPVRDTSRVLQNRKLGLLITQFRQLYDLVLIDSPPVLPVPDALIIGRWVDGAVLAVRYDVSRFPQVERARRQLDGAGITVLGTVINGMRHSDSYYGRYSYNRRRSPQADPSGAL
jgi:capsular exopolysaccharide synthesis family protein